MKSLGKNIFLAIFITLPLFSLGQLNTEGFKFIKAGKEYTEKVLFVDSLTGDTVGQFNIFQANPYNQLDLPIRSVSRFTGNKIFDIQDPSDQAKMSTYLSKVDPEDRDMAYKLYSTTCTDINYPYLLLVYNLHITAETNYEFINARNSSFIVLDNYGNTIHSIDNIGSDAYECQISQSGRYIIYGYGQNTAHIIVPERGLRIYDVNNKNIVYENNSRKVSTGASKKGIIVFRSQGVNLSNWYYAFVDSIPALYGRDFSSEESALIDSWDKEGFKLKQNGTVIKLTYSENFERLW